MRRATVGAYSREVDSLYSNEGLYEQLGELEGTELPQIKDFLRKAFALALTSFQKDASDDADIFSFGVDSLQVLRLTNVLSHAVPEIDGKRSTTVTPRIIYSNPTTDSLAKALQEKLGPADQEDATRTVSREQRMSDMAHK